MINIPTKVRWATVGILLFNFQLFFSHSVNAQSSSNVAAVVQCANNHIKDYVFNHPNEPIPLPQTEGQLKALNQWAARDLGFDTPDQACLDVFREYVQTMKTLGNLGR